MTLSLEDAAKVGGSDLASLLGRSPWGTPFTIYARIVSAMAGRAMPQEDSAPKRRGRALEEAVLRLYAEETGATLKLGGKLVHPRFVFGRASLDAVADRDGLRVVDAKTTGLSEVRKWGEVGTDEVPEYILYQLTWYTGILGHYEDDLQTTADIAALVAGDLRVYHVPFDGELFGLLEQAVERFWVDHVLPRKPPAMTDPLVELPSIGALYPRHAGDAKAWESCSTEEQDWSRKYLHARDAERHAKRLRVEAEARVRMLLGTTPELANIPGELGGGRIDYRQNKPSRVTDWEKVADRLRAEMHVSPLQYNSIVGDNTITKDGARPLVVRQKEET